MQDSPVRVGLAVEADCVLRAIRSCSDRLSVPDGVDQESLLCAIAEVESSFGSNRAPRHEPAYDEGGYYYKRSSDVRAARRAYGALAACSWSSWQILYVVARELGFRMHPIYLDDDDVAIRFVVRYLNKRALKTILSGVPVLDQVLDAYNTGSAMDGNVNREYIRRGRAAYDKWSALLESSKTKETRDA